ncbi:unnamed protein product [Lasius platythorax]|uniref:Uncharacterized protein n=1 Tax=Lasius platythorax TaxID=488582 RepID=A0AAV2P9G8_9HYME
MFAIRNSLTNTSRLSGVIARTYHNTIVSTPPRVKISTAEKLVSLFCIAAAILGTPMYMVPNFKNYAKRKE